MTTETKPNDFASRLTAKMRSQGISKMKLHKMTGISYEMVRRYASGEAKPREDKIVLLAEALSTTASYLDYGVDVIGSAKTNDLGFEHTSQPSDEGDQETHKSNASKMDCLLYIPVLNFSQAENLHKTKKVAIADSFEPVVGSFYNQNAYWIVIEDDSMHPCFKPRDLVLIDPDLKPVPSDFVLACLGDDEGLIFRKWRPRGFNEDTGKPYEQLLAEHEDYPILDSRYTAFEVCGVAVERKQRLK